MYIVNILATGDFFKAHSKIDIEAYEEETGLKTRYFTAHQFLESLPKIPAYSKKTSDLLDFLD